MRSPPLLAPRPTVAVLHECFICHPEAGSIFWRARPVSHFVSERAQVAFNARWEGREALTNAHPAGYHTGRVTVGGVKFGIRRARVIWAMVHGEWPALEVGHRNQNFGDDRIGNLRLQTAGQRGAFSRWGEYGRLGVRGVAENGIGGYVVNICAHGRTRYFGTHHTLEAAIAARNQAALDLHGEFARLAEAPL